jgi:DNA-cytosine methyltransferase
MKVLSLFDGMSCGQLALNRLGIKVDTYYASEIDKYAMQVTQANFPETIQVGDVCNLDPNDFKDVDLMLAGSPCQGFSFAGKQLAFDDPRSALFFEFIRLLKEIKPKYFLLENVKMKKEYLQVISEQVSACYPEIPFGIEPIFINSSLVSAQNRQRYYWTNIPNITQPEERGIVLRDILETEPNDPTLMSDNFVYRQIKNKKDRCLVTEDKEKASSLSAMEYVKNGRQGDYLACDNDGVPVDKELGEGHKQDLQKEILPSFDENLKKMTTKDEKAYCLTATYSAAYPPNSMERKQRTMIPVEEGQEMPEDISLVYDNEGKSHKPEHIGTAVDINGHDILKRVYSPDGKSPTVNTCQGGNREPKVLVKAMTEVRTPEANKIRYEHRKKTGKDWSPRNMRHLVERKDEKMNTLTSALTKQHIMQITKDDTQEVYWRKLTPRECERLQTVPDDYTNHVSNTQRYKMLGNGWTIEVITHILKNMEL